MDCFLDKRWQNGDLENPMITPACCIGKFVTVSKFSKVLTIYKRSAFITFVLNLSFCIILLHCKIWKKGNNQEICYRWINSSVYKIENSLQMASLFSVSVVRIIIMDTYKSIYAVQYDRDLCEEKIPQTAKKYLIPSMKYATVA